MATFIYMGGPKAHVILRMTRPKTLFQQPCFFPACAGAGVERRYHSIAAVIAQALKAALPEVKKQT
ncbi:MAG: hypothetical protein ACRD4Q_08825 [Candidatus Acidiferrales bacterium]